jgi:hypothetical protein
MISSKFQNCFCEVKGCGLGPRTVRQHRVRCMADRPPWSAMELLRAQPKAAPVVEGVFRWHEKAEGRPAKLSICEFWWRGR